MNTRNFVWVMLSAGSSQATTTKKPCCMCNMSVKLVFTLTTHIIHYFDNMLSYSLQTEEMAVFVCSQECAEIVKNKERSSLLVQAIKWDRDSCSTIF